jgi:hypothetical protein
MPNRTLTTRLPKAMGEQELGCSTCMIKASGIYVPTSFPGNILYILKVAINYATPHCTCL